VQNDNFSINSKEIYENILPDGSFLGQLGPREWKRFEDTVKYVPKNTKSLLDVGCFCGEWLHFVLQKRPSIENHLGIDVAQNKIDKAKEKYPELNLKAIYAEQLDFAPNSFDIVTCLEVLEHIPDWLKVFHSLFHFARHRVLIGVPYREKTQYTCCVNCGKSTPLWGHLRSYTEDSFPQLKGWSLSFTKLYDKDPSRIFAYRIYSRFFNPRWLLAKYERNG